MREISLLEQAIVSENQNISRVKFLKFRTVEPLWNAAIPGCLLEGMRIFFTSRPRPFKLLPAPVWIPDRRDRIAACSFTPSHLSHRNAKKDRRRHRHA